MQCEPHTFCIALFVPAWLESYQHATLLLLCQLAGTALHTSQRAVLRCAGCVALQFTGEETNVSADSAGDDLYTWNVELWRTAFKPDCQLAKV